MLKNRNQGVETKQSLKRSFNLITLFGIGFLALTFSTLVYQTLVSRDAPVRILHLENMAFEVKSELTLYQLSLQKIVIGEPTLQPERIDSYLQNAMQLIGTMLQGGEYRHQLMVKLEDPVLVETLQNLQNKTHRLKVLGDQWMGLTIGVEKDQDILFDTLFEDILANIVAIQSNLSIDKKQRLEAQDLSVYELYGGVLVYALILLVIFYYNNRRYYQANQRLISSESKAKALFNASVDVSVTFNEQLLVQSFNNAAEKTFGYSEAEVKGQPFNILLAEPYASSYFSDMQKYLNDGETEVIGRFRQLVAKHKNDTTLSMDARVNVITVDGEMLFVASARDISERLKQEQENRDLEARTRAIVDSAVDGIITINAKGVIETYNHAAETIFGYTAKEIIGQNVNKLMPAPYALEHDAYIANYLDTKKAKIIGVDREVIGQRKNGETFPIDLSIAEVKLDDKLIFTGIVRDITQRKLVENQLLEAKEDAERANHAKSDFLSRMSHELRTPLNAILGFAQILEMDELSPSQTESVHHIIKAGRHLTALINEVLDIARIESGRQELSLEPLKISELLSDVSILMSPLATERNIHFQMPNPGKCDIHIIADLQRLKQVLLNLMSNALKYNHDAGKVELFCEEHQDGILRINVRDTGPGIAPDNLKRVFEPFERLDADAKGVEGSGVGLALSKALVEAMGGVLGLDSQLGKGSTFWIELPTVERNPTEIKTQQLLQESLELPSFNNNIATVLYIEDNIANFRLVEVALSHRPHINLMTAMQGELGLDLALRHQPDLILLDIHLPVLMGDKVLARLKAQPETQRIPVVVISADATRSKIDKLLAAGAHSYLTKPFNIKELLHTVDTLLEEVRMHKDDNPSF